MLRKTGGPRRASGISSPCFLLGYSLVSLFVWGSNWGWCPEVSARGCGDLDTLPHASRFFSATGIPAHVLRLGSHSCWTFRHMPKPLPITIKISIMFSDSWAGLCQQAHVKDCLTYLALPVPLLRQVYLEGSQLDHP